MVFLTFLLSDKDLGTQFLNDMGLIRSKVPCKTCGHMTWYADPTLLMVFYGDAEGRLLGPNVFMQARSSHLLAVLFRLPTPSQTAQK
jgi:hypothetical protein